MPHMNNPLSDESDIRQVGSDHHKSLVSWTFLQSSFLKDLFKCRWDLCSSGPYDVVSLGQHLLNCHTRENSSSCRWRHCSKVSYSATMTSEYWKEHLLSHALFEYYCFNSSQSLVARIGGFFEDAVCSSLDASRRMGFNQYVSLTIDPSSRGTIKEWLQSKDASDLAKFGLGFPPMFGCQSCNSMFAKETDYLRHVQPFLSAIPWRKKRCGSQFTCSWIFCNEKFESYERLHSHIEKQHWCTLLTPFCFWDQCSSDTKKLRTSTQWLRHLLLHSFVESRICATEQRLHANKKQWNLTCRGIAYQKPSYVTKTVDNLLWHSETLESGFRCGWHLCDYITDSAQLFVDHVVEHGSLKAADGWPLECCWVISDTYPRPNFHEVVICRRQVRKLSTFKEHLYRHSGLPKFICDQCHVGFSEFNTFKEHFSWSISDPTLSDTSALTSPTTSDSQQLLTAPHSTGQQAASHSALLRCSRCSATFITPHRLIEHRKSKRCISHGRPESELSTTVTPFRRPRTPGICTRVAGANHLLSNPSNSASPQTTEYFCQVNDCKFRSEQLRPYMDHFRRCHRGTKFPYFCHLCKFNAKESRHLTKHFHYVHRLFPTNKAKRFTYTFDPFLPGYYTKPFPF